MYVFMHKYEIHACFCTWIVACTHASMYAGTYVSCMYLMMHVSNLLCMHDCVYVYTTVCTHSCAHLCTYVWSYVGVPSTELQKESQGELLSEGSGGRYQLGGESTQSLWMKRSQKAHTDIDVRGDNKQHTYK